VPRQRALEPSADLPNGLLGAWIGALKVAQLPRPLPAPPAVPGGRPAIAALGFVVLVTLPLLGIDIYRDWLRSCSGPRIRPGTTAASRSAAARHIGVACSSSPSGRWRWRRGRDSAAWLGVALVVASPSVHGYTFLFLLPGLLTFRRDVAFRSRACSSGSTRDRWWMATLIVAYLLLP